MNKNVELATALSFLKDKTRIAVVDALAEATKQIGVETTADGWRSIRAALEFAVDNSVNNSHGAFRQLLK